MPRAAGKQTKEDEEFAALLAAREEFVAGFRRSGSGNLTQRLLHPDYGGPVRLTVFEKSGRWHWVMDPGSAETGEASFSPYGGYEMEDDAISELFKFWAGVL